MANRKKEVYKPKPMTEGKRNLIQGLFQEYDIQSADDIQEALKDLLSGTLQDMLEKEMDDHLGYDRYERSGEPNYRNGTKSKTVRSKYGEFQVDVPQDRQSSFEPQVLPKRQKDISSIDDKIIALYAKGMTTRQISEMIEDIYGFEVSEGMVSDITDKLLPRIEEWQNRPLSSVYPIVFIDAVHFSVRDDGVIRKLADVVLGINEDGMKEVLSIVVGENESSKYWLSVLNSLKNRGVQDILILCSDGLTGIKDAISAAFPKTEQQRCIVHMVRNTLKFHLIQAFSPNEVSNEEAHQIGKELADRLLEGKYSYVLTRHTDKGHVHNHLIFCSADNITFSHYHDCKKNYWKIRNLSDTLCQEHNLSTIMPDRSDGCPQYDWSCMLNQSVSYGKCRQNTYLLSAPAEYPAK